MDWRDVFLPVEAIEVVSHARSVVTAGSISELVNLACNGSQSDEYEVAYEVPHRGRVVEARVCRVRNGISVNYTESYMRRRDPDSLVVGDALPTDKPTFQQRFGQDFASVRQETFDWLADQDLVLFFFTAGRDSIDAAAITPLNAAFFALGLAMLQGITPVNDLPSTFKPKGVIYTAPIFRYTHFNGKQVVVHNRRPDIDLYEMFSYNLYPGPSAKKGVYGMLLDLGEREGWVTTHCSTVRVVTPYDNVVTFMHEGASGGGKSEMLEQPHRTSDGRLLLGENILTGERRYLQIPRNCDLNPVTDDMALCHPAIQAKDGHLRLMDAERAWFVRVNHITRYGTDLNLEQLTAQPASPLLFLNIDAEPRSRAMIWEHIMDAPGKPCPNPRVVIPRQIVPNVIDEPVAIDIRSFGVRTPPCTRFKPTYGIIGLFHLLPPALAWLWRLVAPRGYDNPSVLDDDTMRSEGVGSYWPFLSGHRVRHANLILEQFTTYHSMRYVLTPSQYIGAWKVGFMPQWIAREYLARRSNAPFRREMIKPARSPLLGYAMHQLLVEGQLVTRWFLQVDTQPEVGEEAYAAGAAVLYTFFRTCLEDFNTPELDPLGRHIIQCCLDGGVLSDYEALIPGEPIVD